MNIYAYRLPHENRIVAGCGDFLVEGMVKNSFLISPFGRDQRVMSIPDHTGRDRLSDGRGI